MSSLLGRILAAAKADGGLVLDGATDRRGPILLLDVLLDVTEAELAELEAELAGEEEPARLEVDVALDGSVTMEPRPQGSS